MRYVKILIILMTALPVFIAMASGAESPTENSPTPVPAVTQSPQHYMTLAQNAFKKNDFETAIFNCEMALYIAPDFPNAHYMAGKAYLIKALKANNILITDYGSGTPEVRYRNQMIKGRNDLRKAVKHFNAAIAQEPKDTDAILNLALAHDNLGDKQEAAKTYQKVIDTDPVSTQARDAYNNLGLVNTSFKEYKKAKECYEKALELDPSFVPARMNLDRLIKKVPKLK